MSFSISILHFSLDEQQTEGPSVDPDALNTDSSTKSLDPKKSTIGQRRAPQPKKVNINYLFIFEWLNSKMFRKDLVHKK